MADDSSFQAKLSILSLDKPDTIDNIDLTIRQNRAEIAKAQLSSLMTKDTGETGKILKSLLDTINEISPGEAKPDFFSRMLNKGKNKIQLIKQQYLSVEKNIQTLEENLKSRAQTHRDDGVRAEQRAADIQSFYQEEKLNLQIIEHFIENCEKQRKELDIAAETNDSLAVAHLQKFDNALRLAYKKRDDIQDILAALSQDLITQEGIRDTILSLFRGIHDALFTQLTEYRNLFIDTLSIERAGETVRQLDAIADSTNNLRQKRAELLNQTTRQMAQHQTRGSVDLERLIEAQIKMKDTIIQVQNIQKEADHKRNEDLKRLQAAQKDYQQIVAQHPTATALPTDR